MVKCKYMTPKHRAYAATARVNKIALPRALFMAAKYRARRPTPVLPLAWIKWRMSEDELSFHPSGLKQFPMFDPDPLVPPERWRSLFGFSLELRPPIPDIDPERVAYTQPEYKGFPPQHIRDAWIFMNYRQLGLSGRIFIDPPKTCLPPSYELIIKDLGLASSLTHVFDVYGFAPAAALGDPAQRQARRGLKFRRAVALFPTHAAIWAAHCVHLPAIAPAPSDPPVRTLSPAPATRSIPDERARSALRMPVVPLPLPYPPRFFALALFVATYSRGLFVGHLLPCAHIAYVLREGAAEGDAAAPPSRGTSRGTTGCNMCVLGMVDDRIWGALHLAWRILLEAMEIVDERECGSEA